MGPFDPGAWTPCLTPERTRATDMNRRQLGLGVAATAMTTAAGTAALAQVPMQPLAPGTNAFYDSFNDQLARLPAAFQGDVRAFYERTGWRPVWNAERLRALQTAASRAERHGLSPTDFFDFPALPPIPPRPRCAPRSPPSATPASCPKAGSGPRRSRICGRCRGTASTCPPGWPIRSAATRWSTGTRAWPRPTSATPICPPATSAIAA